MSAGEELARACRGDVFAVLGRDDRPVLVARHTGDPTWPWEITGDGARYTTGLLLAMDNGWVRFGARAVSS